MAKLGPILLLTINSENSESSRANDSSMLFTVGGGAAAQSGLFGNVRFCYIHVQKSVKRGPCSKKINK